MKYRRLGKTELTVSVIGVGAWQFGGEWGQDYTVAEVAALLGRALKARLTGRIVAAGPGFALESGAIAGYFTLDQLVMLIQEVQRFCGADDPPGICALIGDQFEQPLDALVDVIVGFVDGLEVRLDGPRVLDCDPALPDDCNAVGVCLRIEATPVVVEGVAAP